jgi:hypothetical protein
MRKVVRLIRLHLWEPNMVRLRKVLWPSDPSIFTWDHNTLTKLYCTLYRCLKPPKGFDCLKSQCLRWGSVENFHPNQSPFVASSAGLDHETALFWIIFLMFWLFVFSSIPTTELKSNYVPKVGPGLEGAIDWHQGHCIIMFNSYGKQITWQNARSCLARLINFNDLSVFDWK